MASQEVVEIREAKPTSAVVEEKEKEAEVKEEVEETKEEEEEHVKPLAERRKIRRRGPKKIPEILVEKYQDFDDERFLTLHFSPKLLKKAPRWKRAKRVAKYVREFVAKYVKYIEGPIEAEGGVKRRVKLRVIEPKIWISPELNEIIWARGAENPPKKLRLRILIKVDEVVRDAEQKPIGFKAELRVLPLISKRIPAGR